MPYPDDFSPARYDAAQGRDDVPNDRAEFRAVWRAFDWLVEAEGLLRSIESSDAGLNAICKDIAGDLNGLIADLRGVLP